MAQSTESIVNPDVESNRTTWEAIVAEVLFLGYCFVIWRFDFSGDKQNSGGKLLLEGILTIVMLGFSGSLGFSAWKRDHTLGRYVGGLAFLLSTGILVFGLIVLWLLSMG